MNRNECTAVDFFSSLLGLLAAEHQGVGAPAQQRLSPLFDKTYGTGEHSSTPPKHLLEGPLREMVPLFYYCCCCIPLGHRIHLD